MPIPPLRRLTGSVRIVNVRSLFEQRDNSSWSIGLQSLGKASILPIFLPIDSTNELSRIQREISLDGKMVFRKMDFRVAVVG